MNCLIYLILRRSSLIRLSLCASGFVGSILPLWKRKGIDVGRFKFLVVMTGGFNSDDLASLSGKFAAYLCEFTCKKSLLSLI